MHDLSIPGATRLIADKIKAQIDTVTEQPAKYSWRIKPSNLGSECVAALWYAYRWVKRNPIDGRIGRIFGSGSAFEAPTMDWLRKAGWEILDKDPSKIGTKFEQWNFKALDGHISAYLDAVGRHPDYCNGAWGNVEAKSYNKRRFGALVNKQSVKITEYEYYVQACIYMQAFNLPFTLLIAVCKDDSDIYVEIIPRDDDTANRAMRLAETVKTSRVRPAKIAESPAFHVCKRCDFVGICHLGEQPDRNCRSCIHVTPTDNGKFGCSYWQLAIPGEKEIMQACPQYEAIK